MQMSGSFEVFVLLDHAIELSREVEPGEDWLLDLTAGLYLAADEARGESESSPVLPGTVRECVARAAELTRAWVPTETSTVGHLLAMLLADLDTEMSR